MASVKLITETKVTSALDEAERLLDDAIAKTYRDERTTMKSMQGAVETYKLAVKNILEI